MRGGFIFFLTLLLLLALVAAANQALAHLHVYLFAGGLFAGMAAYLLPFGPGFAAVFAAGLACDANAGVPFGTHALLFASIHCVLFRIRDRLPHDDAVGRVLICLACNMALFIALTLQRAYLAPAPAAEGYRVVYDFLFSQIAVAVAGPWFYHLQRRALALARAEPVRSLL
jgi:rod shape-determining protein MreD